MTYLMENESECERLELKTDIEAVIRQASWAGIEEGMRVLDVGCGIGKTTHALGNLVGPDGQAVGIDYSEQRIATAREKFTAGNVCFELQDFTKELEFDQEFDAIWIRFVLEYFQVGAMEILQNVAQHLKPGGILCIADLDSNSLNHYGHSERLERTLLDITGRLNRDFNFDPYAGRRLYSYLYDQEYLSIDVMMEPHHLIFGKLSDPDAYNWMRKLELTAQKSGCKFEEYEGDYEAFRSEFEEYFESERRFTYTMLVVAKGIKP